MHLFCVFTYAYAPFARFFATNQDAVWCPFLLQKRFEPHRNERSCLINSKSRLCLLLLFEIDCFYDFGGINCAKVYGDNHKCKVHIPIRVWNYIIKEL